ncbi:PKD repeat-containing protein [Geoalkalibacter ferrihydriticus]|nr:PKD domain-containing protein [Geoalkalibacter ferrihydriticus]SDL94936.1 PKD repeat-containing protein [Geoalkalibacter ferrihydriticus]
MKKISSFRLGLVLFFAVLAAACGGGGGGDEPLLESQKPTAAIAPIPATVPANQLLALNGSGSDPGGATLSYFWSLARPDHSNASLSSTSAENPTLVPDVTGDYTVSLFVSNGTQNSETVSRTFEAVSDQRPVANAGPDQAVAFGQTVQLNGSDSFDPAGADLTYQWILALNPGNATLNSPDTATPTFTPAQDGVVYVASLIVSNGDQDSLPDTVDIVVGNVPPQANIDTGNTTVALGHEVVLDGRSSTDPNGNDLVFTWSLVPPEGSQAELTPFTSEIGATNVVQAPVVSFIPDLPGAYEITLEVSDGELTDTAKITITANEPVPNSPPVAAAGPDRTVALGFPVDLNASPSEDPDGDQLSFQWTFVNRPDGSSAQISPATSVTSAFTPDVHGRYEVRLTASDGQNSDSTDLTITVVPAFFRTYGGEGLEEARSIAVLPDGYLIAGESNSAGIAISNDGWDLTVFRTDLAGRVVDTLVFDNDEVDETWAMDVDGERLVLTGATGFFDALDEDEVEFIPDAYVLETNLGGEILLDMDIFGGADFDMGQAVRYTSDGGIIMCGYSESSPPLEGHDLVVSDTGSAIIAVKIAADGTIGFAEAYGGQDIVDCWAVAQNTQGYLMAGFSDEQDKGGGRGQAYLMQINENGEMLWDAHFGELESYDEFFDVKPTTDNGHIAVGFTNSFGVTAGGMYLVKVAETTGTTPPSLQWQNYISNNFCSEAREVQQTSDGYVVGGFIDHLGNCLSPDEADAYFVKVDNTLEIIWERIYGGVGRSIAYAMKQTPADGGFLLGGDTDAFGPGSRAMVLIKTDADGRVPPIVLQNIVDLAQNAGTEVEINTKENFAMVQHDVDPNSLNRSKRELVFSAIGLPTSLSINAATGVISGTLPSTPAEYHITVIARDDKELSALSAATTFTLTAQ